MVESAQTLQEVGREKFIVALSANATIRQRLAATLCGLEDDPFSPDLPVRDDEIEDYLKNSAMKFGTLDSALPADLSARAKRVYLLLIRARLEQRLTKAKPNSVDKNQANI